MSDTTPPVKVFLLDDHDVVRRGVAQLIEAQDDLVVIGEGDAAAGAADRIVELNPDVAVLDISLGDGSGLDVCREITERSDRIACLMLTSVVDDRALLEADAAGAVGFCLKTLRSGDLVGAIRSVASGAQLLDGAEIRMARRRLDQESDGLVDSLTPQERSIFDLIGRGYSNKQVGAEMFLAEKTVKNYLSSIFGKLGVTTRTSVAAMAARLDERESQWRA